MLCQCMVNVSISADLRTTMMTMMTMMKNVRLHVTALQCAHAPCSECISAPTLHEPSYYTLHKTSYLALHKALYYSLHEDLQHKTMQCGDENEIRCTTCNNTVMYFKNPKSMCTVQNCSLVQCSKAALKFSLALTSNEPQ